MRRRDFLALAAGAVALSPLTGAAQQKQMPVIGVLHSTLPDTATWDAAFRQGLNDTGFVEGQSVAIEHRSAEGHYDRLPALAADLVGRKIDVLVAQSTLSARAAKGATSNVPIVFTSGGDPVAAGLVASLARPGGNMTGLSFLTIDLTAKRLDLLFELVPQAGVICLLLNPQITAAEQVIRNAQEAARAKGVKLNILKASTEKEIDAAFVAFAQQRPDGLLVGSDPFFGSRRDQLVALVARHAIPAIFGDRETAASGGLMSYGTNLRAVYRQAGVYTGRVLKGARPADLPVEQPTKFELVINLKTAKAIGLTVPQSLLARADEVIE